ncbi:DUF333 domain-containing protein [Acinetobacter sp. MD2(2019)]|uniref:putative hemolysin n=1 Tax=Acinetobacter sp. MD2(2019) TaxID=2605273 RepID=UPI002D1F4379|nr:DUF333 domain-containing protein [Acinetobacter sp. MD2(2019)]MEB3753852.1 DUF333 domain-containing protein [Acinetobacter sp. MD2(2019)]
MKKIVASLAFIAPTFLIACSTTPNSKLDTPPKIGMANPASVYCQKVGGQSIIQKDKDGNEIGYCKLPNGQLVDEWQLFRSAQEK